MHWQFGLIGYPLGHSFSKKFFENKFALLSVPHSYALLEVPTKNQLPELLNNKKYRGFNVTIPYKTEVMPYLTHLDKSARLVGAVNVIKHTTNGTVGYNTDYPAFKATLKKWLDTTSIKALVLGTGGASKAVITALQDLKIEYLLVSRIAKNDCITYEQVADDALLETYQLVINTTPLGMAPNSQQMPKLPYNQVTPAHYLYDLVYNPIETQFLAQGKKAGAFTHNGLDMLHQQAELAWEIWEKE